MGGEEGGGAFAVSLQYFAGRQNQRSFPSPDMVDWS